jgi:hypothetical protein
VYLIIEKASMLIAICMKIFFLPEMGHSTSKMEKHINDSENNRKNCKMNIFFPLFVIVANISAKYPFYIPQKK